MNPTMDDHGASAQTTKDAGTVPAAPSLHAPDALWRAIRDDALAGADRDSAAAPLLEKLVLSRSSLSDALIGVLAWRLGDELWRAQALSALMDECLASHGALFARAERDLRAVFERDPACQRLLEPLLFFKGFHALQAHRVAHFLWSTDRRDMALFVQSRVSARLQVDIHPATSIGAGVFFDHATGIVIGETAVIDDDVSILQNVTLGGTGKEGGDRHPKVRRGVLVGAGAKVLGNIIIGEGARIAASSVVLDAVPARATVAGIPARIISIADEAGPDCMPSLSMDHGVGTRLAVDEGLGI